MRIGRPSRMPRSRWDSGALIGVGGGIGTVFGLLVASASSVGVGSGIALGAVFGAAAGVLAAALLDQGRRR
jgi:hypothetical protein